MSFRTRVVPVDGALAVMSSKISFGSPIGTSCPIATNVAANAVSSPSSIEAYKCFIRLRKAAKDEGFEGRLIRSEFLHSGPKANFK